MAALAPLSVVLADRVENVMVTHELLKAPVEFMRFCVDCDSVQPFFADRSCDAGLIGHCRRCGVEILALYTRANSEAV